MIIVNKRQAVNYKQVSFNRSRGRTKANCKESSYFTKEVSLQTKKVVLH
nr:MAG TPA: hypothetical protein [Caudoviricetes sp.]